MTFKIVATLVSAASLLSCGQVSQPAQQEKSLLKSVDLPQTQVRNQEKAGFCWSYAALSLVESLHKSQTGQSVNLNEHALVFAMHIAQLEELLTAYKRGYPVNEIVQFSKQISFQGWVLGLPEHLKENEALGKKKDVLDLLKEFGAIRKEDWKTNYDFKSADQAERLARKIQSGFERLITRRSAESITRADLEYVLQDAWGTRPPETIYVNGRRTTPQQYLEKELGFDTNEFTTVGSWGESATSRQVDRILEATKLSLAAGYSVPVGFAVSFDALRAGKQGQFGFKTHDHTTFDRVSPEDARSYVADGGHAVLITDFKNVGGKFGKISKEQLVTELQKQPSQVEEVLVKNSWGFSASSNESGVKIVGSESGYYTLDQGYLRLSADSGLLDVIVPKWIAQIVNQNFYGTTRNSEFSYQQLSHVFSNSLIHELR